jgi:cytochrome oxidase assembly protein ShyY1
MLRDLVNRGIVPQEALEPARPTEEDVLRDLVNRGIIPRQALPD